MRPVWAQRLNKIGLLDLNLPARVADSSAGRRSVCPGRFDYNSGRFSTDVNRPL